MQLQTLIFTWWSLSQSNQCEIASFTTETTYHSKMIRCYCSFIDWYAPIYSYFYVFVLFYVAGEIGGNMGLFLGCSLLTIFEFLDFLICFIATLKRRYLVHAAWRQTFLAKTIYDQCYTLRHICQGQHDFRNFWVNLWTTNVTTRSKPTRKNT